MKRLFLAGIIGLSMLSCSKKENVPVDTASPEKKVDAGSAKSSLSGEQMIESLDCS